MPGAQRRVDPGVARRLLAEPFRFEFFQAVRVLECLFVRLGARPRDVVPRRLHFRNSLSMAFPASEIEKLVGYAADDSPFDVTDGGGVPDWSRLHEVDLTPAVIGMLGAQGVLPYGYTELIGKREMYHRDHAARAFLDIFFNRAVALFYGAWKKYRLAFQYELDRRERFLPLVLALSGTGLPSQRARLQHGRGGVYDQGIAYYAAIVGQRPLSAAFLQRVFCEYLAAAVRVEQFVGAWYDVPVGQCSRLGAGTAQLGRTALSGGRVWQRDLRLRLWIGPLRAARYRDFLPGGEAAGALAKWLTLLGGDTLEYEVRPILHQDDVRPGNLSDADGGRLGWDMFLTTQPATSHRSDAGYLLHTLQ